MLRPQMALVLIAVTALAPRSAAAAPARALREPIRLTAGASSDLMGVLGQDGRALYFVSDANGTMDLMVQAPVHSGPVAFSSGLGDAAWPQVSPDGNHVAYLYFERDSTGDVCVREARARDAPPRCLTSGGSAELQVLWWDTSSLAVLSRRELHGDFALRRIRLDGAPSTLILERNMISLALSPDRRWIAYIPVTRGRGDVGITFSQRTGRGIGLDRPGARRGRAPEALYLPPLPGATGAVAFARDGAHLYFTQYLNDTNGDGAIDGDDNAVLFRVPFRSSEASPITAGAPAEQLTSARWDCHYPAPSEHRLLASCSHEGSLDVYALPLDGAVPPSWNDARLGAESASARDLWTRLLLAARRLALAQDATSRDAILLDMIALHLELGEHESAIYYAEQRLVGADAQRHGRLLAHLARHRRAELRLTLGETSDAYLQAERARGEALRSELATASPRAAALARLVISEIEDDIGEKEAALATFRAVSLPELREPHLVQLAAQRAERIYRLRADREALSSFYRACASIPGLGTRDRLELAHRFIRELGRGRARAAEQAAVAEVRARLDGDAEIALLLDARAALLALEDVGQEAVAAALTDIYQNNPHPARRRALVLATLSSAARAGNEVLRYQLVTRWLRSLSREDPERKYAEVLHDFVVLDRAYAAVRRGDLVQARTYFHSAAAATGSLEALVGLVEVILSEGSPAARRRLDQTLTRDIAGTPEHHLRRRFVEAYLRAREVATETDLDRVERVAAQLADELAVLADELPREPQIHQLWGYVLHQQARRSGSTVAAAAAHRQYLLALDLARDDERLSASLAYRLGLLQAELGSHGAAVRHLTRRGELPHIDPHRELAYRLALSRSAWHRDETQLARDQALLAEELAARPELAHYGALALDRLALALASAGDHDPAHQRYAALVQRLERDPHATPSNRLKAQLGLAANALASGQTARALLALERADGVLDSTNELEPEPGVTWRRSLIGAYRYSPVQYAALIAGLRAVALRSERRYVAALDAAEERRVFLQARLYESDADEDRLELAQAEHHLARVHYRLGDVRAAARAVERGLELSDRFNADTGSEVNEAELALIRDYAELHLYGGLPRDQLRRDLAADLDRAYRVICQLRSPSWAEQRFVFKTYLTQLALTPGGGGAARRSSYAHGFPDKPGAGGPAGPVPSRPPRKSSSIAAP